MAQLRTSDGVRLHYEDQGSGVPVVLIAGFRASATSWLFQTEYLLNQGYRVISFDRRGHGSSETVPYGARMGRHGQDLAELLSAADLYTAGGVTLIGGSMGASTIWSYLDLHGTEGVSAIITVDQTPKMSNEDGWEHGYYEYGAANLGTFFAAGPPATGRGTPMEQRGPRLERLMQVLALQDQPGPMSPAELALLRDHAVQDWRDVIARIDIPALLVAGRDSELWPAEHAPAAAALNPLARSVVIQDCGHAVNIEQPDAFNSTVLEFLRS